jgi:hypothetical protein
MDSEEWERICDKMQEASRAEIEKLGGAEQLNEYHVRLHLCGSMHTSLSFLASVTTGWAISTPSRSPPNKVGPLAMPQTP